MDAMPILGETGKEDGFVIKVTAHRQVPSAFPHIADGGQVWRSGWIFRRGVLAEKMI